MIDLLLFFQETLIRNINIIELLLNKLCSISFN